MKKIDKQFLLLGLSVIALSLCAYAPDAQAQNDGTVSAVGTPSAPDAKKEFPPQPVSVAPEEVAPAPVADTSAPPAPSAPAQPAQSGLLPSPVNPPLP
jgi:hypothetical protein